MTAHLILLVVASSLAGAINSVAGGGTLLTFPALLAAGLSPIAANATSTVALVPGSLSAFFGYRRTAVAGRGELAWYALASAAGSLVGALTLVRVGDAVFGRLVPFLILGATALFVAQEPLRWWQRRRAATSDRPEPTTAHPMAVISQFFVGVYGGFFGAGMGIAMLAVMGLVGYRDLHRMNRLKNLAAAFINGIASVAFGLAGRVRWPLAALMAVSAVVGGYAGAGVAQRIGQKNVRRVVVAVGVSIGAYTLIRHP